MIGEADEAGIKGLTDPEEDFTLAVSQHKDTKGREGNLTLALPKIISIFEVDPRDRKDEGTGPQLYKE